MREKSSIKKRILEYLDLKGISKYQFYKDSGIARGVLDKNSGMSEDNIARFIAYAPQINISWLILGKGAMEGAGISQKQSQSPISNNTTSLENENRRLREELENKNKILEIQEELISLLRKEISRFEGHDPDNENPFSA
ncbi:MAG TPA: hypothetical protein VK102_08295 [Sphingobacterium sp.]|nr:hypothetical protein [Sphingobacterium sp.]